MEQTKSKIFEYFKLFQEKNVFKCQSDYAARQCDHNSKNKQNSLMSHVAITKYFYSGVVGVTTPQPWA